MNTSARKSDPMETSVSALRVERDRFVALAFCWADVLIELDSDAAVVYAAGATQRLLGIDPNALIGRQIDEFVYAGDKALIQAFFTTAKEQGRVDGTVLRFLHNGEMTPPLAVSGYRLEEFGGHFFMAIRYSTAVEPPKTAGHFKRDEASGLLKSTSFIDVVSAYVKETAPESEPKVTFISFEGYDDLTQRLDNAEQQQLSTALGSYLRGSSINGDAAMTIGDGSFGLLHKPQLDIDRIEEHLTQITREVDPTEKGAEARSRTVSIDRQAIAENAVAQGLVYAIDKFRQSKGRAFTLESLSNNISALAREAIDVVDSFKEMIATAAFDVAFQPIIDVKTGAIHHYEALVRFANDAGRSPYEQITFAERTGLIVDFDLAMTQKVVTWLASNTPINKKIGVAVNVSGFSAQSLPFLARLDELLKNSPWSRGQLMFEITESARMEDLDAANGFLQRLRQQGYAVCLDDLGAGAASFRYLSSLDVDIVKIDGSTVQNAARSAKGKAFLKALAGLCHELGVATVAEMIETVAELNLARACGIEYVQGFLFGKPSLDIRVFPKLLPKHMFAPKAPTRMQMRQLH